MGFFDDEEKMYIPLTIDTAEVGQVSYFFSNRKMVELVVMMLPYMFMMFPMIQGGVKLAPILVVTGVYIVLYYYFIRFRILEEKRLREMIRELDENRVSGVNHFWGINKIGHSEADDGVIYYERVLRTERGLVIAFDRGSTVGVPRGNYTRFRQTKMEFLRELSVQKFNFQWYEIPKRSEMPESLRYYFNRMTEVEDPYFQKLIKLQIDINTAYTKHAEQRYVDYIVIRNTNFRTLRRFKAVVQGVIDTTLATSGYIIEPRILGKSDVERFFEDVLQIDSLDSNNIRKGVEPKPFETYASVKRIIKRDGRDLPLEFMDNFDLTNYKGGTTLEGVIEQREKRIQQSINDVNRRKELELDKIRKSRTRDDITDKEYREGLKAAEDTFAREMAVMLQKYADEGLNTEVVVNGEPEFEKEDEIVDIYDDIQINVGQNIHLEDKPDEDTSNLTLEEMIRRDEERKRQNNEN